MKIGASTVKYDDNSLQSSVAESFSATATSASPAVFTANGHGLNNTDAITLTGTAPTGFNNNQRYFVVSATTNTFKLAGTPTGTAINSSSTGSSIVIHINGPRLVSAGVYTSMPVRIVGRLYETFVTGGTWVAPTELDIGPLLAPQDISFRAQGSSTSISGSLAVLAYTTISYDTNNGYDGTITGWVCPFTGKYQLNNSTCFSQTGVTGDAIAAEILKNGTIIAGSEINAVVGAGQSQSITLSDCASLNQGDYITVQVLNQNTSPSINSTATFTYLSIKLVN